ncbi:uncharacterized protein MELLADRAFT_87215 [Melampsora larici-populina 98AG31]|uniref:Uncharacterized protein n=1 Tax=Melampsora larici-populina (strain 98AG31 / pathotype 3-4-7) TaxID=747676 RepID=F4R4Y2_MELLP|nr:uncharacterized protein MELLADRAFT_87215 [Melampsora larici-populina 98AG31]EGG12914.1 hypothetical protein MELLADRAFT_87215 [Melampsora larici-populina 98AG31]
MARASKAAKAQKKRWKEFCAAKHQKDTLVISDSEDQVQDIVDKALQLSPTSDLALSKPSQPPITINLDSDSDIETFPTPQPPQSVLLQSSQLYWMPINPDYLTEEDEMDPLDVSLYAQANLADSLDDEACSTKLVNKALITVFTRPFVNPPTLGKRQTKTGQILKGYKQPRVQPSSNKLAPHEIPKETKRQYRLNREKAIGKSTFTFDKRVVREPAPALNPDPDPSPPSSPETKTHEEENSEESYEGSDHKYSEEYSDLSDIQSELSDNEANNSSAVIVSDTWIDECVDQYRSSKAKSSMPPDIKKSAQDQFDTFNAQITAVSEKYKQLQKEKPNFEFPSAIIDDLCEYNAWRLELTISAHSFIPAPSRQYRRTT